MPKTVTPAAFAALRVKVPSLPRNSGAAADLLYETRQQRLAAEKQVESLRKLENQLQEHFINTLNKKSTGVAGRLARVQIVPDVVPTVENWDKFYAHIKKTGEFELLQRRVNNTAVTERWDNKKQVPGVGRFNVKKVSCTLIKQR